jgi:hypothetical protein
LPEQNDQSDEPDSYEQDRNVCHCVKLDDPT